MGHPWSSLLNALTIVHEQKYCHAIDDFERLVVQQLFKMLKLGMSGVSMSDFFLPHDCIIIILQGTSNMKKLSKSLKAYVNAIQSALKHYNEAAAQLNPPRPALMWEAVMNAVTVADFDIPDRICKH